MLAWFKNHAKGLWKEEEGLGTLEMILILVVILIIALIFKNQITALVNRLFSSVNQKTNEFLN